MHRIVMAAIVAGQLAAAPAAAAADLIEDRAIVAQQAGSFSGARIRVALGGGEREGRVRAGLVMAPTLRSEAAGRRGSLRFGEGIELGLAQDRSPVLSIAGRALVGDQARRSSGPRAGVSTLAWVAIGTGIVLVAGALLFVDAMNDASE
jgi:hypothetical protein